MQLVFDSAQKLGHELVGVLHLGDGSMSMPERREHVPQLVEVTGDGLCERLLAEHRICWPTARAARLATEASGGGAQQQLLGVLLARPVRTEVPRVGEPRLLDLRRQGDWRDRRGEGDSFSLKCSGGGGAAEGTTATAGCSHSA